MPTRAFWVDIFRFFSSQWVMGLLFFLFPVASSWLRATYLPVHAFCGLGLLAMAVGTSLLGITEKLLFSIMYVRIDCLSLARVIIHISIREMSVDCSLSVSRTWTITGGDRGSAHQKALMTLLCGHMSVCESVLSVRQVNKAI